MDLQEAGERYKAAREYAENARLDLMFQIQVASRQGLSENEISRIAGVTRMTVRKALGKS